MAEVTPAGGVLPIWRRSLQGVLDRYDALTGSRVRLLVCLFAFFVFLNLFCYWLAMLTAFPGMVWGERGLYYFKCQFPVGVLGALFDTASFFVTVLLIRRALSSPGASGFLSHLSVDLLIAALATLWVLFVFTISGWIVHLFDDPQSLGARSLRYTGHVTEALRSPTASLRNIYFGIVMGASAALPTCLHAFLSLRAVAIWLWRRSAEPAALPAEA